MMLFHNLKPPLWGFDRGLVAPEWWWYWRDALAVVPFWEKGGAPYDLVQKEFLGIAGSPIWSTSSIGVVGEADETGDVWSWPDDGFLPTTRGTIAIVYEKTDATNRGSTLIGPVSVTASARFGGHLPWATGDYFFDFGGTGAGKRLTVTPPTTQGVIKLILVAGPGGLQIWQNGVKIASNTTAASRVTASAPFSINSGHTVAGDLIKISVVGIFDAEWTESQCKQWSADPFGPLHMEEDTPWLAPVVVSGFVPYPRYVLTGGMQSMDGGV